MNVIKHTGIIPLPSERATTKWTQIKWWNSTMEKQSPGRNRRREARVH